MEILKPPNTDPNPSRNNSRLVMIFIATSAAVVLFLGFVAALVLSSGFSIEPGEVGVVLRFGAYDRMAEPGVNLKLPAPVEVVYKIPIQRQLKQEFGFQTVEAGIPPVDSDRDVESESRMITGDLDVAVVEWIVQYRVSDPYKYLFKVRDVTKTFRGMNEAVMRAAVGDRSIDEVITIGRLEIEDEVTTRLRELCDRHEMGIMVDQIVLYDVNPPEPVKPAFNAIIEAEHERERAIRDARAASKRSTKVTRQKADLERVGGPS